MLQLRSHHRSSTTWRLFSFSFEIYLGEELQKDEDGTHTGKKLFINFPLWQNLICVLTALSLHVFYGDAQEVFQFNSQFVAFCQVMTVFVTGCATGRICCQVFWTSVGVRQAVTKMRRWQENENNFLRILDTKTKCGKRSSYIVRQRRA